ncbi:MAG: hypothetical protein AAF629_12705 [Chloroflexota bacterium]
MTPTLIGRWQTRIWLMNTIGLLITFGFAYMTRNFVIPFLMLAYVTGFGIIWDIVYDWLQSKRWDRDWPPIFFVISGIVEAAWLWGLIQADMIWRWVGLASLADVLQQVTFSGFSMHYISVWLVTFLIILGPIKILSLKWRFQGGQWIA